MKLFIQKMKLFIQKMSYSYIIYTKTELFIYIYIHKKDLIHTKKLFIQKKELFIYKKKFL